MPRTPKDRPTPARKTTGRPPATGASEKTTPDILDGLLDLFEHLPAVVLLVDPEVRIRRLSREAQGLLLAPVGESIARRAGEALHCLHSLDDPAGCGHGPHCPTCPLRVAVLEALRTGEGRRNVEATITLFREDRSTDERIYSLSTAPVVFEGRPHVLLHLDDLTERRRTEDVLRQERARVQTYVDVVGTMLVALDRDGRISLVNPRAAEVLGRPVGELVGRDWFDTCVPPLLRRSVRGVFARLMAGDLSPVSEYENHVVTASGEERLIAWRNTLLRDAAGRPSGTLSSGEDVTDHRRREAALRLNEERLAVLLELSQMGDLPDNELFDFALEQGVRLTRSRIGYLHFVHDDQVSLELARWSKAVHGGCTTDMIPHYPLAQAGVWADCVRLRKPVIHNDYAALPERKGLPEGHFPVIRHMSVPVFDGEKIAAIAGVGNKDEPYDESDVRQLELFMHGLWSVLRERRAKLALRESEETLRVFLDTIPAPSCLGDRDARSLLVNRAMAERLGQPPESIVGSSIFDLLPPEIGRARTERYRKVVATGRPEIFEDQRDGKDWLHHFSPVPDADGTVSRVATFSLDITARKLAERIQRDSLVRLRRTLDGTVEAISRALETRDPYTAGHQRRVADLARAIAREMGLAEEIVDAIGLAGCIHDIGKLSVPAEILAKPAKLSAIEFGLIMLHPQTGYEMIRPVEFPWPVHQFILQHHERLDGSGYPNKLAGEAILLEARIIAVADIVEAMASHRPYRPALGIDAALAEIRRLKGGQLDPGAVDACTRLFVERRYALPA
jgi:PAS domain S-box-containing protein